MVADPMDFDAVAERIEKALIPTDLAKCRKMNVPCRDDCYCKRVRSTLLAELREAYAFGKADKGAAAARDLANEVA